MSAIQVILVSIVALFAGIGSVLDEFQSHRPLIACTLVGLVLGDIKTGIVVGGTLEMMALGWMNIGAALAPDAAMASVISTILVIAGKQSISTGIALAIPIAAAGQILTILVRTLCVGLVHRADIHAEAGNIKGVERIHLLAVLMQGLRVAIPAALVAMFADASAVQNLFNSIPPVITGGLNVAGGFIVVVGYAMVINMMGAKYLMPFFFLGFVIAGFTDYNLVALGVIGTVLAIIYIQLNPKYNKAAVADVVDSGQYGDDFLD
ncbi:PTS mannose/fructose/sorbose transporter subunit IIC [Tepidimicrobium xylanilyticum]